MNCQQVRPILLDHIFAELDDDVSIQVYQHLNECSDCSEEEERLRKLLALTVTTGDVAPPDEIYTELRRRVKAGDRRSLRVFLTKPIPLYAAGLSSCILAFFALWLGIFSHRAIQGRFYRDVDMISIPSLSMIASAHTVCTTDTGISFTPTPTAHMQADQLPKEVD